MFANLRGWIVAILFVCGAATCVAGGPRFVAGSQSTTPGAYQHWRTDRVLQYFTDPGDLNRTVTHAQADAVVAAAAAVWNAPTSSLTVAQGGVLAEHVSSANTFFDGANVVFPADVMASAAQAKPIAVIYDSDGSMTDLLLGAGASDISSCRQHEVTESVDAFGPADTIDHAVLIINGRCVGSSQDQMMQLQYLLMRSFGRVLGLGWSQLNDNVFTGVTTPTSAQMAHWPVMHPIDVVCGPYTYLCMVDPFTLREDDLDALAALYPVTSANIVPGKVLSVQNAIAITGMVRFSGLQGMDMVNIVVSLQRPGYPVQGWQTVSGLSGVSLTQNSGNPVTGAEAPLDDHGTGSVDDFSAKIYYIPRLPLPANRTIAVEFEAVNPLYTGEYALGPFQRPPASPSGTLQADHLYPAPGATMMDASYVASGTTLACNGGFYGSESAPAAVPDGGWWSNQICGVAHPAWGQMSVRAGHSWTVEVQATDETGGQTVDKLQPVIGVWNSADPLGVLPTVAAEAVPMNAAVPGMSQLVVDAPASDSTFRFTLADFWGGGRPDFTYKARVLYADAVTPAVLGSSGGQITITGMGFVNGNRVTVNGVTARVLSWSATQIVAVAPAVAAAKTSGGVPVEVAVLDLQTGGSTRVAGALTYAGAGVRQVVTVSAPAMLESGVTAGTAFAVKVLAADGVTAVNGASVRLAVAGGAQLAACGTAASCTVMTNALGMAQSTVSGLTAGSVTLSATELSGSVTVQVNLTDADPVRSVSISTPAAYVAAGATVTFPVTLQAVQDGQAAANVPVSWNTSIGVTASASLTPTAATGATAVSLTANALPAGTYNVTGCAWTVVCAVWNVVSVAPAEWRPGIVSGAGQSVPYTAALAPVVLRVNDTAGHPLAGAVVRVDQTVEAWQGACPTRGRCPAAAVLASQAGTAVTDANGLVSVAPLQIAGVPQVVNVAVIGGSAGFVTLTLVKTP